MHVRQEKDSVCLGGHFERAHNVKSLAHELWQLHQLTPRLQVKNIFEATALLKRKFRQNPRGELAVAIALDYWLLALRADTGEHRSISEDHICMAARCRNKACRWLRLASRYICEAPVGRWPLLRQANRR